MSRKTVFVVIVVMSAVGLMSILAPLVVMMGKGASFLSITGARISAKMFAPVIPWIGLCYVLMALVLAGGIFGLAGRVFKRVLLILSGLGTVLVSALMRPRFRLPPKLVEMIMDDIKENGMEVKELESIKEQVLDPDDTVFCAASLSLPELYTFLITGNIKHYPKRDHVV